ncbi:MAG: hypothetical protein AAFU78_16125 [Cyanobacteria bacterium J06633_2]
MVGFSKLQPIELIKLGIWAASRLRTPFLALTQLHTATGLTSTLVPNRLRSLCQWQLTVLDKHHPRD